MTAAFFGHKNAPGGIKPRLEQTIQKLIGEYGSITFLVGTNGNFDRYARDALASAAKRFPEISCFVVLAYMPENAREYELPTVFPEEADSAPKRFAIDKRNSYMLKKCDIVICYITHTHGGAWKFVSKAEKLGKMIINLAD